MKYQGRPVFNGYAIEDIFVYVEGQNINRENLTHSNDEYSRFNYARKNAIKNFDELYNNALDRVGEKEAELFQTYKLMAEDLDFEDLVRNNINDHKTAEEATKIAANHLANTFSDLDDEYMKQRAIDVIEVGKTIIDILLGTVNKVDIIKPSILICNDLSSALLMRFDRSLIKGLVLINGNENSHVSIFARTLEIPTLVALKGGIVLSTSLNNHKAIVDAVNGTLIIDPDISEINIYRTIKDNYDIKINELKKFINQPSQTKDGVKLKIYANIASTFEIEHVKNNDAEGIGLFRSEFIYLGSKSSPTEDFQFNYYREVLEEMKGKEVIIRTLDIGADKKVPYLNLNSEVNPALGYRSVRLYRDCPEILYTQLRALYRASIYGRLLIMIPMIVSLEEVNFVKDMINKIKLDLTTNNIPYDDKVKIGIMIETPAAALISDKLAKEVDFFSIGTNDLSQYTLACDRLNPMLSNTFNPLHPAILRLIKMVVDNAHHVGIPCGMCGELARHPSILPFLVKIHIDEISCSSAYVLSTRKLLSTIDTNEVILDNYLN